MIIIDKSVLSAESVIGRDKLGRGFEIFLGL